MNKHTLRPYQSECVEKTIAAWNARNEIIPYSSVMTGLGKSLIMADITEQALLKNKRVLQLVPRKELVEQNYGEAVNYVTDAHLIGICAGQLNKHEVTKQCVIAMASSFVNRRATSGAFDIILIDECFSPDTLISTPLGLKRIDLMRCGDTVYNATGIGKVNHVFIKPTNKTYILEFSDGTKTECTGNHKFFTHRGWKEARKLEIGEYFYSIKTMLELWSNNDTEYNKKQHRRNNKISIESGMEQEGMLLNILLEEIQQSHVKCGNTKKSEQGTKGDKAQAYKTWRERAIAIFAATSIIARSRRGMGIGSFSSNESRAQKRNLSKSLQDRHSEQRVDDRNRSGWSEPFDSGEKEEGRKKSRETDAIRLVNISSIEHSSATPVYNISVEGHPSYFADGKLVHNCHRARIDADDEPVSTYNKILKSLYRQNPKMLVAGFTGTPFRLDQGELHEPSFKGKPFFTHKVYDTTKDIPELIKQGYLSHIQTINTHINIDLKGVRTSGKDFNKDDVGVKFDAICSNAVADMKASFDEYDIKTALIFVSNLSNARHVLEEFNDDACIRIVHGGMAKADREAAVKWIKHGDGCRYIVNVDILAEGFDFKALQCCVLMRATKSPGLLVQMAGRIIRPHDNKRCGYLLDYGTNCERLGNIDNIIPPKPKKRRGDMPKKICGIPECQTANVLSAKKCIKCGAIFISEDDSGNYKMLTKEQALQQKKDAKILTLDVESISYELAASKSNGALMIKMQFWDENTELLHKHYICLDHVGKAKTIAKSFVMKLFNDPKDFYKIGTVGASVQNMIRLLQHNPEFFKTIDQITIAPGYGQYMKLKKIRFKT